MTTAQDRPTSASSPPGAIDHLLSKVALQLIAFCAIASAIAGMTLMPHPSDDPLSLWIVIPFAVLVSGVFTYWLAQRGHVKTGAAFTLVTSYLALLWYVTYTGLGLRSYSLGLLGVMVAAGATLVGKRAGVGAMLIALATIVSLYYLEKAGRVTDFAVVRSIPPINVAVAWCIAFAAIGMLSLAFERAFSRAILAAQRQEAQFRRLIEAAPLGYVVHRDGRVVLANRRAAIGSGLPSPEAMVGMDIHALLPGVDADSTRERLLQADRLPGGETLPRVEHDIRRPDGLTRRIELSTMRIELPDGAALLSVVRDVTDERNATAALADAKRRAEAANVAKSEFLATMSHELRTPLNAVVGLARMARQPGLDPARRDDYLARIDTASHALLEIISDVLDLSKIEAGALQLESVTFDPRAEIDRVSRMHENGAAARGLAYAWRVDEDVPAHLRGDPVRLRQVLANFASNALKFTPAGGVDVRLAMAGPGWIRLEVKDTGIGIDPDLIERLFQPFTQADGSTSRRYGGTGLGLAVCRRIVEHMGGRIGAESRPGAGSTFWIEVPMPAAARPAPASPAIGEGDHRDLRGARVLLVEDNEINQMVAIAALEDLGVVATVASGGEEAIAALEAPGARFDAVLMDLHMPGMDGFAATRAIRGQPGRASLPVIALTADAFDDVRERCESAGMDDYLTKPFDFERLKSVLGRWIRR